MIGDLVLYRGAGAAGYAWHEVVGLYDGAMLLLGPGGLTVARNLPAPEDFLSGLCEIGPENPLYYWLICNPGEVYPSG